MFAPVRNLGLIVVDEGDGSYKQEENPRYNGRDVAIVRARRRAPVVLRIRHAEPRKPLQRRSGQYTLLELPDQVAERPMPKVHIVDMREEFLTTRKQATFSRALIDAIHGRLDNSEQAIVLLNRRGFSGHVACRSCGARIG